MEAKELVKQRYEENPDFNRAHLAKEIKALGDTRKLESIRRQIIRQVIRLKKSVQIQHPDKDNLVSYSAIHPETLHLMDEEEFCDHHGLKFSRVHESKLVTHAGTPYYNIRFKGSNPIEEVLDTSFIESVVLKHVKPVKNKFKPKAFKHDLTRVIISDEHIGMDIPKDSLYGGEWNKKELFRRADILIQRLIDNKCSDNLHITCLGDLLDGYDGTTVRKGHQLPQNMDNQEQFDVGVEFKMYLVDNLVDHFDIQVHNICNDNHSGWFGYTVNSAFKKIAELKHGIKVVNYRKFMNHYYWNNHCFVITHGKDDVSLKFGFKPQLDTKGMEKIDNYLKQNSVYSKCSFVEFDKGDSHQALFDNSTSEDFNYHNHYSFAPQSGWVQANFKKGRSGFTIKHYEIGKRNPVIDCWEF